MVSAGLLLFRRLADRFCVVFTSEKAGFLGGGGRVEAVYPHLHHFASTTQVVNQRELGLVTSLIRARRGPFHDYLPVSPSALQKPPPTGQRLSPWEKSLQLPPGHEVMSGSGNECDVIFLELLLAAISGEGSRGWDADLGTLARTCSLSKGRWLLSARGLRRGVFVQGGWSWRMGWSWKGAGHGQGWESFAWAGTPNLGS